jgi:hypothetical protein
MYAAIGKVHTLLWVGAEFGARTLVPHIRGGDHKAPNLPWYASFHRSCIERDEAAKFATTDLKITLRPTLHRKSDFETDGRMENTLNRTGWYAVG